MHLNRGARTVALLISVKQCFKEAARPKLIVHLFSDAENLIATKHDVGASSIETCELFGSDAHA